MRKSPLRVDRQTRRAGGAIVFVLLASALLQPERASAQADIPPATARLLAAGEIVVEVTASEEGNGGRIVAVLDIAATQRHLWDVMLDCRRSMRIVENLKSCKGTSADPIGRWDVREHIVQWLWPLPTVRSEFRSDYVPFERIRFRKTAGDLKALEGVWRLQPVGAGQRTRLHYEAIVDPGVPLPGFLVRNAIETDVRRTLASLRREASGHDAR